MRQSGILMHITSLPGPYGVGTLGKSAYEFVDFLKKSGQSCWQLLPLNPTGYGDSPYQSCSSCAGNHYLIDLDLLVEEGLLRPEEIQNIHWGDREDAVDFGLLWQNRLNVLRLAYERFDEQEQLDAFIQEHTDWLPDFSLYMALKDENGGKPWYEWPEDQKCREFQAIWDACERLAPQIRFYCFTQYIFRDQWMRLHAYANQQGIEIIGDVPIYVPLDSVDVWTAPELFQLDENLTPTAVAGCPPDAFAEDGQLWGNPLYDWDAMQEEDYYWWLHRLDAAGDLYDIVRLDHFRGFEAYWSIPYGDATARNGQWRKGTGMEFVNAVKEGLPNLKLIAEDLGFLTPEVLKLRDDSGWPGMKVLQFAFDAKEPSEYQPHTYIQNTICYTGTHDNMTLLQWLESLDDEARNYARDYMNLTHEEGYIWGVIRTAQASVSNLCVAQMQDYLGLGGDARMNFPGRVGGNWVWRMRPGSCSDALAEKIRWITKLYGRLPEENTPFLGD